MWIVGWICTRAQHLPLHHLLLLLLDLDPQRRGKLEEAGVHLVEVDGAGHGWSAGRRDAGFRWGNGGGGEGQGGSKAEAAEDVHRRKRTGGRLPRCAAACRA